MVCTRMGRLGAVAALAALPTAAPGQLYGTSGGQNGGGDAGALKEVYQKLGTRLQIDKKEAELSSLRAM